jgi:hypothetical protein
MGRRARTPFLPGNGAGCVGALLALALLIGACAPPEPPTPPAPPPPEAVPPPEAPPAPAPVLDRYGRMIVEAMEYPWSALGRVNTGGRGFCTGILIGPRLVLATARCLYNGVEGRWWAPGEVHFVAGYQRDAALIHAGAAGTEVAPDFVPGADTSLASVTGNWALITLQAPLGLKAGWLALQRLDRAGLGGGFALQAGYRRGWAHSTTVKLGCVDGWSAGSRGATGQPCDGAPENPELPFLLFLDGEFRALANPVLLAQAEAGRVTSAGFRALARDGARWGESRPPNGGGRARPLPADTTTRLLGHLGHLRVPAAAVDRRALEAAIRRFQRDAGLGETGALSLALLGHLMDAARKAFTGGAAPRISWHRPAPVSTHEADRGGPSRLGFAGRHEQAGHLGRIAERAQDDGLAPDRREVAGRHVGQFP